MAPDPDLTGADSPWATPPSPAAPSVPDCPPELDEVKPRGGWGAVAGPWVTLHQVDRSSFRLVGSLTYTDGEGSTVVPDPARPGERCWTTDLASVPFVVWGQLAPFGRQTRAAIVHDYACRRTHEDFTRGAAALRYRERADRQFLHGLLDDDVPRLRALLMWAGVSIGRIVSHAHPALALLLVVQLIVGAVILLWAALGDGWTYSFDWVFTPPWAAEPLLNLHWHWDAPWVGLPRAAALGVLPLALLWGPTSRRAVLLVQVFGLLAAPIVLANLALSLVIALANLVVGGRGFDVQPTIVLRATLGTR